MQFLILFLFYALPAHATILSFQAGNAEIEKVKLSSSASGNVEGKNLKLSSVGAGLRYKKVAFVKAKVYVGELFVDDPAKLIRSSEGAVASIDQLKAIAIRMIMMREVDAKKMSAAFEEGLKENGISLDKQEIRAFLSAVQAGSEAKEGKAAMVLGLKLDGGDEAIVYEDCEGKTSTLRGESGFIRSIFSIWLGKMNDSGLENLRKGLLGL